MMEKIEIRPVQGWDELKQIETLQREIWTRDEREVTPAHMFHALQYNGSALYGAFDGVKMIGFTLAVLATVEGLDHRIDQVAAARLKMYSAMAGVLPGYRDSDVGYHLKLAQKDFATRIGVRLITWTYDPLESRNGRFNIGKIGAICHTYIRNFHGEMSGINSGLDTDRFDVEWWITSNRAKGRTEQNRKPLSLQSLLSGGALLTNESTFNRNGLLEPPPNYISHPSNLILVEIPANFQEIKERDFALAVRWREHTRTLFENLFDSGFLVTDFVRHSDEEDRPRSYYLLTYQDS
jgi:predicted GNAT superfamily acetyltransferase